MLSVENIDVYRGKTHVLRKLSLSVDQGEIVALVGANGAGKTTTLRTVSGLLHPARGRIDYTPEKGKEPLEITGMAPEQIVQAGISHCPEGRGIFSQLSVKENLLIGAYLRSDKGIQKDLDMVFDMFPILEKRENQAGGVLSGGEQMMLALGRALMSRPRLLILDEPSLGLAPLAIEIIFNMIQTINAQGVTILIVEQNAVMALELSSRAYVIETGRVLLSGSSRDLACDPGVQKAFLGGK
ncbi:ABC transporter ATP-binding protein [Desulfospira joergensenii]|uniref:ABC transporter ATP-binding protein n=1 Tax=Desulfospira joergensenii TaxID=53329 RepID=UPI0003B50D3C|nr:ABC transporter ATP-binding protein [Desulfospira joergensenii]